MKHLNLSLLAAMTCLLLVSAAQAGERRFVYSYEAQSYIPGSIELENWVTWKDRTSTDRFDFRHEIEVGLTERMQLGFYVLDWRYEDGDAEARNTAFELIYNLTNPNTDWLGSSLYGEVKYGPALVELEGKVILQKNWGPLALAYNFILEAEWEGDGYSEDKGEIAHTLGLSYMISPKLSVGTEFFTEVEIEDWDSTGSHAIYLGPNASFRTEKHWFTAAALWEMTETGESDFQLRAIWGWHLN